jgi:hypothetical protein
LIDRLLATVGNENLAGGDLPTAIAQRLLGDGLTQRGQSSCRGIPVILWVTDRDESRLYDVVGSSEIGLASGKTDHRATLSLESLSLRIDF